ncbi:MAG: response regulator [Desulfobacter sp.]|nr:response regulator [Desulfobacter sp.]
MANQAFANFVGLQPENIINKSCADLWPEKLAEQFEKEDLCILETGFPIKNQRLIKDRQNTLRRFQVVKKSLKGQTRSTDGIMGISRDITIRHEYEEQLKQYKRIVDTSQDQIALINRAYQYEAVSDSYLKAYGFEENQMLGKTIPEVLSESIFETKIKPRLDKGFSGQMFNIQDEIKYQGIGNRQVDITICPYTDHSGKTNRLVVHIRDISEKIQMEKQLVTSQKMEAIGTLAGGIAHDFNNILSGILGYAQLGKLNLDHPEKLTRHLEQIIKGSNRAVDMVRQILTFSRKYQYKKHPLKIALIVKEAAKLLRASIPSFIEIKTQVSSQSTILADPTHIHQVIMNLCTNSFQAISGDKGLLSIQLDDVILTREEIRQETKILPGAYVKLRVRDTGTGMDDHTLEKIFNPYFTTKETGQGTGMGLSIVHGIVQDHGGFILVDSQLNKGTCFSVFFPVHDREKDSRPPGETDPILPGQKETIMVVDDEPSVLESSVEFLKDLGYQVHAFKDSLEALDEFKQSPQKFDLVITDMTMPKMTGERLSMKMLALKKDLPIILCTDYSERITKKEAQKIGILKFIEKPIVGPPLSKLIRDILDPKYMVKREESRPVS